MMVKTLKVLRSVGLKPFCCFKTGRFKTGCFKAPMPGDHNALNALATIVVGMEVLGLSFEEAAHGVESFEGVGRRFQLHPENKKNIVYIDDYAHHPTEIENVLKAAQQTYLNQRLVAIFQPHRYSRVKSCWDQFLKCFNSCDLLLLTDVYPAGEEPIRNYDSEALFRKLKESHVKFDVKRMSGKVNELHGKIQPELQEGDVVVVMGAGNINQLTSRLYS